MGNWESPYLSRVMEYLRKDHSKTLLVKILHALNTGHWFKSVEKSYWCDEINDMLYDPSWGQYRILVFSEETRRDVRYIFDEWEKHQVFEKLQPCDDDNNPSVVRICPCGRRT